MGVEVDGAACPRGARPAAPDIGWLPRSRSVRPHLTNFGLVHTTTIPGHLSRAKIWLPNYYYSSMAHWHVQNFEEEKIKGTRPRRSSTLFIHHVMVITCLSQRQEENDPFGTWIPQSCHGDDDLFQQATCRLLASHHRKLWVPADAYGARDVRWRREFFVQTNRRAWELGQKVSN